MTNSAPEELLSINERRAGPRRRTSDESERTQLLDLMFRRHYRALLQLAVVMLGDRGAAEDAVQDAFVALHRHGAGLRDPEASEAYLRSAVLNRCRSWVRRQVTSRAPKPLMLVREQEQSAEDATIGRDEVGSLVAVMRTLARRQREVLACRYVLELSIAETAQLLQISEGSVKAHAHRGLQALEKRIEVAQ